MSKRFKNVLYNVLVYVAAAVILMTFWVIGLETDDGNDIWNIVLAVSLGVIGLLCVINVVAGFILSRKFRKMNTRELFDYFNGIRIKAQSDITGVRKKTVRIVVLAYVYLALIFALLCLGAFAGGRIGIGADSSVALLLVILYLLGSVIDILFKPIDNDFNQLEVELTANDFPLMRKTAERAATAVGYNGKIKLFLVGNGVSVSAYRGIAYVTIGYKEAALLTSDELYAVMLHEFAHVVNADVSRGKRLERIQERWDCDALNTVTMLSRLLLFKSVAQVLGLNIEFYKTFSAIDKERAADDTVRRLDGNGSFADALAKTEMIAKYFKMPVPELDYYFFESETPHGDYATIDYKTYLKFYQKYGDFWHDELIKELPAQVDTHPTARMRIQSFGLDVNDCNANATESDPMYVVEQQRVIERADSYIDGLSRDSYAEQREQAYVQRKAAIDALDKAEASGSELSGGAREEALRALLGIDDDRTLILADKMIADGDRVASANFAKGYVYKRRHDDRCVECFKNATKEPAFAEEAYGLIGEYALLTGNEKLIAEYRESIPEVMQTAKDRIDDNAFKKNSPTQSCDLDTEIIAQFAAKINDASGNGIKTLYICKYVAPDGSVHYPFAFDMTKAAAMRSNRDFGIYYGIYDIIQSYNGEPSFIMCNPQMGLMRNVKKSGGVVTYDCVNQTKVEK
ncbi:MAG: hypothetical protein K2F90_05025 [Clostridiales bacterium]|nr:hypothetical protein [Clostridiales bacterium]